MNVSTTIPVTIEIRRSRLLSLVCGSAVVLAGGLAATAAPAAASQGDDCTIAAPPSQATIEARIAYARRTSVSSFRKPWPATSSAPR